jgi:hypothetical protein
MTRSPASAPPRTRWSPPGSPRSPTSSTAKGIPDDRPPAALEAFINLVVEQPAEARMCVVESYAAGTTGIDQIQGAIDGIIRLVRDAAEQMSDRSAMRAELLRGIIGGLYQVIYGRLRERREGELPDLVPGLWEWTMSFPPPPRPLRRPRPADRLAPDPDGAALRLLQRRTADHPRLRRRRCRQRLPGDDDRRHRRRRLDLADDLLRTLRR